MSEIYLKLFCIAGLVLFLFKLVGNVYHLTPEVFFQFGRNRNTLVDEEHRQCNRGTGSFRTCGCFFFTYAIQAGKRISLIITDYNHPGMGGIEFAQLCKRLLPHTPVLCFSSFLSTYEPIAAALHGKNVRRAFCTFFQYQSTDSIGKEIDRQQPRKNDPLIPVIQLNPY